MQSKVIELFTCDRFCADCQVYKLPQARINSVRNIIYSRTFYTVTVVSESTPCITKNISRSRGKTDVFAAGWYVKLLP